MAKQSTMGSASTGLLVLVLASAALADRSTPFVESTKVGDVRTEHGWVVALDPAGKGFVVLVTTDTFEYVAVDAEAAAGVVSTDVLGRPAVITGEILARPDPKENIRGRIRIVKVEVRGSERK